MAFCEALGPSQAQGPLLAIVQISPFYRTLSPIGAAALPPPMKTNEIEEQGKGTADHLMPLGNWFKFASKQMEI